MSTHTTPNGGPAFPFNYSRQAYGSHIRELIVSEGMTLRDWFAGMALTVFRPADYQTTVGLANEAYAIADAMLERRLK